MEHAAGHRLLGPDRAGSALDLHAPPPGVAPWEQIARQPLLWHFDLGGRDALRLVQGRERIYLDYFWNDSTGDPRRIDEGTRAHYARLYARPGAIRAAFAQFQAIRQDAQDNETRVTMPVLAIGGEKSFGASVAVIMNRGHVARG